MTVFKPAALQPLRALAAGALVLGLVACATPKPDMRAGTTLQPTRGSTTGGKVDFAQTGNTLKITGQVTGLKPNAEHGFHVHEKGDCSSGDGMSTGGHFNPSGAPHGQYGHGGHHVGDLPSLKADDKGVAKIDFESTTLTLKSGPTSIVGKGLIVHKDPDDYKTQPTGNSGARLACGLISLP